MNNTHSFLYNLATDRYKGVLVAPLKLFLFILSLIYGLAAGLLVFFCRLSPRRFNCKVISVGNITLGGTGKTVLVELVARYLSGQGRKVAVISRGSGHFMADSAMVDEPQMLKEKLKEVPVIVDADRARGAEKAVEKHAADTVILDDGFQQWRIGKDLEIIAIDAVNPFGNRRLLPRGILREPLSSLRRADIFVLTKTNLNPAPGNIKDRLKSINPRAMIIDSAHRALGFYEFGNPARLLSAGTFKGSNAALFSGIGDPDSFERLAASLGINIALSFRFPDHHNYSAKELEKIFEQSKNSNIDTVITTEKDAARIARLLTLNPKLSTFVLRIELEIKDDDKERFFNRLSALYSL